MLKHIKKNWTALPEFKMAILLKLDSEGARSIHRETVPVL